MKTMKIFNTYTNSKEEFKPINSKEVSIYYCGPTVYNYVHLGNFRPPIIFDILNRTLKEIGYNPKIVSNYTDIDDKIINQAKIEKKSEKQLSEFYIKSYEECLNALNILPIYSHPKASEYIEHMVEAISKLIDTGYAYKIDTDIYFRESKIKDYGKLSKQNLDDLNAGSRIDVSSKKENPFDFVLWKYTSDDGIKFDTKIGLGRPGWHTECVVMVNNVFKQKVIDIHGGGFDLKFPHHENEIAQSIALNNTTLANYWMHVGFLLTNGEKMSKSLNNSTLAIDVLKNHTPNGIRLFFASTHYRSPINYTEEILSSFDKITSRYYQSLKRINNLFQVNNIKLNSKNIITEDYNDAINYLCDDLNTSNVITILDKELKEINQLNNSKEKDYKRLEQLFNTFIKLSNLIGLSFDIKKLTSDEIKLYKDYLSAYENKDYATSDKLRNQLIEKDIL